jgi:hypothetical protein
VKQTIPHSFESLVDSNQAGTAYKTLPCMCCMLVTYRCAVPAIGGHQLPLGVVGLRAAAAAARLGILQQPRPPPPPPPSQEQGKQHSGDRSKRNHTSCRSIRHVRYSICVMYSICYPAQHCITGNGAHVGETAVQLKGLHMSASPTTGPMMTAAEVLLPLPPPLFSAVDALGCSGAVACAAAAAAERPCGGGCNGDGGGMDSEAGRAGGNTAGMVGSSRAPSQQYSAISMQCCTAQTQVRRKRLQGLPIADSNLRALQLQVPKLHF